MAKSIYEEITAIILAGGESSRMGTDKALLSTDNNAALIVHVCQVASQSAAKTYVISPWVKKYQDLVPSCCQLVKEQLVLNEPSNTPLIGFAQALQLVETEWALLLACDLPHISSSQVKQWSLSLATVLPTEIALLPRGLKGWEPLAGFYRRSSISSLNRYISTGQKSFQSWLTNESVRELPIKDRQCLFNCNTPEDLKQAKIPK